MESSDSGTGVADCSVGAIVWVRRRNGSWWPGKILGPDELSASHLMSPRSGTPVKLLGREDASVDWYNLEKSKRVKAFRCGEFDDCIERAEASQGIPPKKRDKYARREDAILHALELEKQLLEKKYGELGCSSNGASSVKKELAASAQGLGYGNGKNLKSHQSSKGIESSHENKNKGHHSPHDNSDVLPRMRGLQDIGPRIKNKISTSVALNGSQKPALIDGPNDDPSNGDQITESNILINSKISLDKRKRSNEEVVEESLVKRRDRRRPLVQVLESSAKLPVPRSLHRNDGNVSPSVSGERKSGERRTDVECNAKRSKYAYLTAQSSGNLEDKEIHSEKMEIAHSKFEESNSPPHRAALSEENRSGSTEDTETDTSETDSVESDTDETIDDSAPIELIPKSMGRPEAQGEQGCMSGEEPDEYALTSDPCPNSPISASVGVSKWQIKGKRNNRGVTKRLAGKSLSQGSSRRGTLRGTEIYSYDETESIQNNIGTQMAGYGSSGPGVSRSIIDWDELAWTDEPTIKGYWGESSEYYDPMFVGSGQYGGRTNPMLIDVDLKVQSSYQREHVPMISLMSKLNGKAIVGHPIPVETLDNGSTEALLGAVDGFWPEHEMVDQDTALPPVWRTARRTANCRVPRPQGSRPRIDRKFTRKPPKKMSLSSSPKIRTLSSIGTQHKNASNKSYHQVDGLIKRESAAPTVVACIPVKLVFSRLHEALVGRHQ